VPPNLSNSIPGLPREIRVSDYRSVTHHDLFNNIMLDAVVVD
jgi:hypothetical protein